MNSLTTLMVKDPVSQTEDEFSYDILKIGQYRQDPPLINYSVFLNHFKLLIFTHGQCRIIIDDREYTVEKRDLLLVPYASFYTVSSITADPVEFYYIHFTVRSDSMLKQFVHSLQLTQILILQDFLNESLDHLLKESIRQVKDNETGNYCNAVLLLKQILLQVRIQLHCGKQVRTSCHHVHSTEETVFNQCVLYLREHMEENTSVEQLCEAVHVSKSYLYRCFKKLLMQSPSQFILEFKLKKSQELLKSTDDSVTSVARNTGFSSIYQFCSAFKTAFGITPTQFRKHFKNQ